MPRKSAPAAAMAALSLAAEFTDQVLDRLREKS
jgi:hypothetical protein